MYMEIGKLDVIFMADFLFAICSVGQINVCCLCIFQQNPGQGGRQNSLAVGEKLFSHFVLSGNVNGTLHPKFTPHRKERTVAEKLKAVAELSPFSKLHFGSQANLLLFTTQRTANLLLSFKIECSMPHRHRSNKMLYLLAEH